MMLGRLLMPLKRGALWLTGQRKLRARIDHITVQLDQLAATLHAILGLHQKVDQLRTDVTSLPGAVTAAAAPVVRAEVDRLDSYLIYHAAELQLAVQVLEQRSSELQLAVQVLEQRSSELQSAVQGLEQQSSQHAEDAAERLTEELDRLDGSILHHMAVLRARLGDAVPPARTGGAPS
jgi:outer membrane murein-binding lipoprotein Lpp